VIEASILDAIAARLGAALDLRERPAHRLYVDGQAFGYVDAPRLRRLAAFEGVFVPAEAGLALDARLRTPDARSAAMERVARILAQEGALTAWRGERYAVGPAREQPAWFDVERAAARYLGVRTYAAHANGLVGDGPDARMWMARRSAAKAIDPSQLDNLVGGGVGAGEDPAHTLVREAWEEAGIAAALARNACEAGTLAVDRVVPDGCQRETIFVYDLWLDDTFVPANQDGEAVEHRCVTLGEAARLIAQRDGPDVVTVDASLVKLDCLMRRGAIDRTCRQWPALDALCRRG
jgi:8-oxo-dGTP pyrophosphatase MutT (NUDIX family)